LSANSKIGEIRTAVILGAGNIAWHLGHCLYENGIAIKQIYNRTATQGKALADSLQTQYTSSIDDVDRSSDITILAVSDDIIGSLACSLGFLRSGILVHTAGAVPMEVLSVNATNFGVIYPLQTFTKGKHILFRNVPLFVEANDEQVREKIWALAIRLSGNVYYMNSEDRMNLHLAAVVSSNFSNYLLSLSEKILGSRGLSFDLLKPLMMETLSKAFEKGPVIAQTGPAARGNKKVIEKHLKLLEQYPEIKEVYKMLSDLIMQQQRNAEDKISKD